MNSLIEEAKFRSRRGLNELDLVLEPFAKIKLESLEHGELESYLELMSWEDNDLADVILYGKSCENLDLQKLITKIIDFFSEPLISAKCSDPSSKFSYILILYFWFLTLISDVFFNLTNFSFFKR